MITYYIAGFPVTDELYHHGIKGQKWGIRRYQNEDGTLTSAGKARYGGNGALNSNSGRKEMAKKIAKGAAIAVGTAALAYGGYKLANSEVGRAAIERAKGKAGYTISKAVTNRQNRIARQMTNKQRVKDSIMSFKMDDQTLLDKIGRLENEAKLRQLTYNSLMLSADPKRQIMINAGKRTAETVIGGAGIYGIKMLLTKKASGQDAAAYITPRPKKN